MEESYTLTWEEAEEVVTSQEVMCDMNNENIITTEETFEDVCEEVVVQSEEVVPDDDVVYLTDNVIVMQDAQELTSDMVQDSTYMDCVTEEVVAEGWEGCNELIVGSEENIGIEEEPAEEDVMIPLPTDQDQYSAMRPYPCDFCSRRFRKKANLMNHMVAHQTDKPHGCNLCGVRYVRKFDLMNHLKIHAYVPETDNLEEELPDDDYDKTRKRMKPNFMTNKKKKKMRGMEDDDGRTTASSSRSYFEEMGVEGEFDSKNILAGETRYPITDPRKPFVCQYCGVGFAREKALASHSRMHQGDSPFECRRCGEMFWDADLMREHIKDKHDGVEEDFMEEEEFSEEEESKYGEFFCPTCGMTFTRQDQLKRHQQVHIKTEFVTDNEMAHICNVCGESFAEALDLLAHAEIHARSSEFRCMLCGDTTTDEQALAAHVQAKHGDNLPDNTCLHCGRTCKDRRALLTHCLEHSKEKTFPCPKCAKTFHNKARLKRHMLSHRNKAVTCDVCGEAFPDGRSLMNHRHSHSSVSGRQFPCRECGKTFGSRSSQQIHIRIHTGERPYGCRFCWKAFADGGTLRKHERIHTGEKPYACAVCPRAFNQRVVLREHIRSHHSGPDPNYSQSMTPYCCAVCSDMFSTSQDLIVHLIHHCDLNTAMRRQPQIGPRKYKRRRKLKPHEMELMTNTQSMNNTYNNEEEVNENINNAMLESDEDTKANITTIKKKRKNSSSKSPDESYTDMYSSFSTTIENINTIASVKPKAKKKGGKEPATPTSSRPKMIHTQKTRVAVESNEGGKLRHRTKTMITRTEPATADRIRPRTKNVSYHVINPEKLPIATFQDATEQAVNSLLELNPNTDHEEIINGTTEETFLSPEEEAEHDSLRKHSLSIDGDITSHAQSSNHSLAPGRHIIGDGHVVKYLSSGILIKKGIKIEKTEPPDEDQLSLGAEFVNVKQEVMENLETIETMENIDNMVHMDHLENPLNELAELSMQHAKNIFRCEMCSATFSDRANLLLHVPVHI